MIVTLSILLAAAQAGESKGTKKNGPLAALPSTPGPHVARIKALGDNQWMVLGEPAPDAKWGVARGRSWGGRAFAYAPDLGGAFFCGEGVHGYTKPDGYYMCDLWFYDANANRWICLYPGVPSKTVKLKLDEQGFEVDDKGDVTPIGFLGHPYGSTTYDPELKKYMVLYVHSPWSTVPIKHRQEWLGVPPEKRGQPYASGNLNHSAKHPLFWDVARGKWERRYVSAPGGFEGTREDGVLQYVPSLKKAVFAIRDQVWFYDYRSNSWSGSARTGCPFQGYGNGCYDPKRQRLYVARSKQLAFLDLKTSRWTEVKGEAQPEDFESANTVCLTYDTGSDVLLYHRKKQRERQMAAYSPETNQWTAIAEDRFPMNDLPKDVRQYFHHTQTHAFYHEGYNAHCYFFAGDSSDGGCMTAYRYRR